MVARGLWGLMVLGWASMAAADTNYQFTMGVISPAPAPGKPFTITWTGGDATGTIYIVLNGYFEPLTTQNIIYTTTDILSNAPNNGSWIYNVPLDITAGRHSFSIGVNPLLHSDTTDIFHIDASQTSAVAATAPATTYNAATYNGCGLPPLPDYTYTGYQPPCTVTTNGHITTLYPIAPASISSLWFTTTTGQQISTTVSLTTPSSSTSALHSTPSSSSTSINTAFATGVIAQALQCPNPIIPTSTTFISSGTTTILSLANCSTVAPTSGIISITSGGVCHPSGYTTFSVSGTSSVCCPGGWATTPLNEGIYCFTSTVTQKREVEVMRAASTEILSGMIFTSAGVVRAGATGGSLTTTTSSTNGGKTSSTLTNSAATTSTTKSAGVQISLNLWRGIGSAFFAIIILDCKLI